ncbi:hypothetical protein CDAR_209421 [Caerostris darwini]|uniref:Uncharacterized protein n=1 Tax=Caerostris darwini TaxID=1538125 RepID=A0AAV4N8Y1_9ARAC|nr:hypothetical protein CDAR_209421 [Caerostris darwini]
MARKALFVSSTYPTQNTPAQVKNLGFIHPTQLRGRNPHWPLDNNPLSNKTSTSFIRAPFPPPSPNILLLKRHPFLPRSSTDWVGCVVALFD